MRHGGLLEHNLGKPNRIGVRLNTLGSVFGPHPPRQGSSHTVIPAEQISAQRGNLSVCPNINRNMRLHSALLGYDSFTLTREYGTI